MEFIVYAAGPIAAVDYAGATVWRSKLQEDFDLLTAGSPDCIRVASPMRGKDYFKETQGAIGTYYDHSAGCWNGAAASTSEFRRCLSSPEAIMTRDFFDCTRADLIFVNFLGAEKISAGTIMEMAWGYAFKIPVICLIEKDSVYRHPMIDEAISIGTTEWDVAVQSAANILIPSVKGVAPLVPSLA